MIQVEYRIHTAIIEHLDSAWPQIEYTHAGKARDETHAHFLSKMGYTAGTGDILWFCEGRFGDMEVKQPGGVQSPVQRTRQMKLERNGGHYVVVHSVQEAHNYWKSLGFHPRHSAVREPDLRTTAEKFAAGVAFFAPRKL